MKFECAQTIVIADTKCLKINTISCILMIRPAQTSVLAYQHIYISCKNNTACSG